MPRGGLEPPWLAPYAPQTYVSTNSTTWAISRTNYFCVSGVVNGAVGSVCGPGAAAGIFSKTDRLDGDLEKETSPNEVARKRIATTAVILLRKVAAPRAPKRVWEPPAPNAAPISAPLPACRRMTMIKNRQT